MKTTGIILLIVIGSIIFVIGGGAGVSYQTQKQAPEFEKMSSTLNSLSSSVVPTIVASGKVTEINGRNVTLSNLDNSITVKIIDDARVYFFTPVFEIIENSTAKDSTIIDKKPEVAENSVQKDALFSDIKKDDNLSINMKMLADGTMIANSVIILIHSDIK